jgi:hypothetical protein
MEDYEEAEEEPPAGDFLSSLGAVPSTLWHLGRDVGEYAIARNHTLLRNEMGLGEYTWIYVITYFAWLGNRPVDFPVKSEGGTKILHGRVLGELKDMIERHLADLDAAQTAPAPSAPPGSRSSAALWRAELEALLRDPARIPFQDGLPPELEGSLEPFRDALERLYCPVMGELEIMRTVKTGLWYDHR